MDTGKMILAFETNSII